MKLAWRSLPVLTAAGITAVLFFLWPLLLRPGSSVDDATMAPLMLAALIPLVLAVTVVEVAGGRLDPKAIAMLGVLSALGAVIRPLGAGIAGIETVFFVLILGGRVFGPAFGFILGSTTLFASALLTAGVGPWLPYQMLAASWIGLGAGLLPRVEGRREIALLIAYGVVAAFAYGLAINLSFWPFTLGEGTSISFVPGAPVGENVRRYLAFVVATSLGWDIGRAVTNALALAILGPTALEVLRRAARRAHFGSADTARV